MTVSPKGKSLPHSTFRRASARPLVMAIWYLALKAEDRTKHCHE